MGKWKHSIVNISEMVKMTPTHYRITSTWFTNLKWNCNHLSFLPRHICRSKSLITARCFDFYRKQYITLTTTAVSQKSNVCAIIQTMKNRPISLRTAQILPFPLKTTFAQDLCSFSLEQVLKEIVIYVLIHNVDY